MYDWANSAFMTTIVAAVFPIFYQEEAAYGLDPNVALSRYGWASTLAVAIVAVMTPELGAMADYTAMKKKMLGMFLAVGLLSTASMVFIQQGEWLFAAALFVFGNIGAFGSMAFYDSLLPHIASPDETDRVSSAGYAIGYLGGGLLLAVNLTWILWPGVFGLSGSGQASRLSFLSVAIWWLGFSIPLFRRVPEPPRRLEPDETGRENALSVAFRRLGETVKELGLYRQAFLLLIAFAIYNDGINTIIRMAAPYGAQMGLATEHLIAAILLVQFLGVPFTFLFGMLAGKTGPKPAVFVALGVYAVISTLAYYMTTVVHFYLLALLVATVQGGSQALSRSMFATMIPQHKSSEFFAFFAIFEKFTGVLGPAFFAFMIDRTGSGRTAILSVIAFFVVGGAILSRVDVEAGRREAQKAEAALP
jgi:UMF1 family MFS transporter